MFQTEPTSPVEFFAAGNEPSPAIRETVYVVDDERAPRDSVCALVTSMGLRAIGFASGEEFLDKYVDDGQPSCLVLDIRMPGMSGLQLQQRLRDMGIELPVVMITAFSDTPVTVQAMRNGAVTLLQKNYRDQELWDHIREALELDKRIRQENRRGEEAAVRIESLSDGERSVLEYMIAGHLNKSMATELKVSVRTIELRRHNIFKQTQTESLPELVRLYMEYEKYRRKKPR